MIDDGTQCVILAGGRGTRISEESHLRPKPMIEIGGHPILWHIMKTYGHYGVTDFVICLGYRGYMIKEYFYNYFLHGSDVTIDIATNTSTFHNSRSEPWRVTLVDTGESTLTGGRILRTRPYLRPDQPFFLTYGDGVANLDLEAELAFHRRHGRLATMTVVRPPARFGRTRLEDDRVVAFEEKPQAATGVINGGFFVLSPGALDLIDGDDTPWETTPIERLVAADELRAWRHNGFWQPMDTLREKELLEAFWDTGKAPWKVWA
ncbi:MAG: glucose-1-phosphate cytidylyltransferase [Acidimicrobiales bacterium]